MIQPFLYFNNGVSQHGAHLSHWLASKSLRSRYNCHLSSFPDWQRGHAWWGTTSLPRSSAAAYRGLQSAGDGRARTAPDRRPAAPLHAAPAAARTKTAEPTGPVSDSVDSGCRAVAATLWRGQTEWFPQSRRGFGCKVNLRHEAKAVIYWSCVASEFGTPITPLHCYVTFSSTHAPSLLSLSRSPVTRQPARFPEHLERHIS